jgi:kynurenine formamidase
VLKLSNHRGIHVDAPRHFFENGKTVDQYRPDEWIFSKVFVADVPFEYRDVIYVPRLEPALKIVSDLNLLLIRTDFERKRNLKSYWSASTGFALDLCIYLQYRFSS